MPPLVPAGNASGGKDGDVLDSELEGFADGEPTQAFGFVMVAFEVCHHGAILLNMTEALYDFGEDFAFAGEVHDDTCGTKIQRIWPL